MRKKLLSVEKQLYFSFFFTVHLMEPNNPDFFKFAFLMLNHTKQIYFLAMPLCYTEAVIQFLWIRVE